MADTTAKLKKQPDNTRPLSYVLFKKYGLKQALLLIKQDVLYDLIHGVDTFRPVSNQTLFSAEQSLERNRYVPTTFALMSSILSHVSQWVDFRECQFLDYGSGKGKALIAAANHPFKSLYGVEYSACLHNIATKNISKLGLSNKISLINIDAIEFRPTREQRVIYFFNPFVGSVLHRCLQNICDSPGSQPRFIVCANPTETLIYEQYFDKLDEQVFEPGACEVNFYVTRGAS